MTDARPSSVEQWFAGLHLLARMIISVVAIVTAAIVFSLHPDADITKLVIALGAGIVPGSAYTLIKGKGKEA